jgi:hypothetical protein
MREKQVRCFQTGDLVKAVISKGVHAGTWTGRVAIRATGSFNVQTTAGFRQGIGWKHCTLLQRADGYGYTATQAECRADARPAIHPSPEGSGFSQRLG